MKVEFQISLDIELLSAEKHVECSWESRDVHMGSPALKGKKIIFVVFTCEFDRVMSPIVDIVGIVGLIMPVDDACSCWESTARDTGHFICMELVAIAGDRLCPNKMRCRQSKANWPYRPLSGCSLAAAFSLLASAFGKESNEFR
jgi:hypothetical protein